MTRTTFFKHFELLADQPDAVAKMRGLVMQLAIRGELIRQNPTDKHAQTIFTTQPKPIAESEAPYTLPDGWIWVQLSQLASVIRGVSYQKHESSVTPKSGYVPVLRANNIGDGLNFDVLVYVPKSNVSPEQFIRKHDVIVAMSSGSKNLVGKAAQAKADYEGGFGAFCGMLRLKEKIQPEYFGLFLQTPFYRERIAALGQGIGINNLQKGSLETLPIPIPPLAEQRRIVAKVDELMALCDELEQRQQARQHASGRLQQSTLHHLLAAREPQTFAAAWQRVRDHFHLLHDTPDAIPQLRQAILQLAVQGRLVPQNPKEVPGHELLGRIKNERERLLKSGKLKNGTDFAPLAEAEIPIQLPTGWTAARFIEIAEIVGGVTKGRNIAGRDNASFPYLRVANVQRGFVDISIMKEIEIPKEELKKYRLIKNDLLIVEGGDWDKVGRMAIWDGQIENCIHQNHIFRARFWNTDLLPRWITLFSNSRTGREYFEKASKQTTNLASINMSQLRLYPIPIPPLAEQKRIVARVEELLRWCDTLEAQLHQTRTLGAHLLASTLHHLLAA